MGQCQKCGGFGFHTCNPEMVSSYQEATTRILNMGYKLRRFVYWLSGSTAERRSFYRQLCTTDAIPFCPWLD
jgi:hypothetical protein